MSTRSDTPVFCDESGTRSAFLQWTARGAVVLVLMLCAGLALTLDTHVRLPGLSRLRPSSDFGLGRPSGPTTVAVPAEPKARPTVREDGLVVTDTNGGRVPVTVTDKRSATTPPTTTARKAQATIPPAATTTTAAHPTAQPTASAATPPAAEPTRRGRTQPPPGQTKKPAPPSAQPTTLPDSNANGNGQGNGLAKGKGKNNGVPPTPGTAPTIQ